MPRTARHARVHAERVAMPDVDDHAFHREAAVAVDLRDDPAERSGAPSEATPSAVFGRMSDRSRFTST